MSFLWAKRHSKMHSLQKTWPFWQDIGSINGFKQRQQASNGLIESFPSLSFCVPYPNFLFSSYVKKAKSLLFFECLCGILYRNPNNIFEFERSKARNCDNLGIFGGVLMLTWRWCARRHVVSNMNYKMIGVAFSPSSMNI